jgi:L-threonylcarbamoyladenylate synthase
VLDEAVRILRAGGLVAFPTETVYGLGADATNERAVRRIFAVKGRPSGHPLIVHLHDAGQAEAWAAEVPETARKLGAAFWPGPLTIVVERAEGVLDAVTGGQSTVALRVPSHPMARELLRKFGGGIAAPSANRYGRVSPTTAAHVREDLGAEVDLILDGGPCAVGVESTIVDCSAGGAAILRPGGVTREQVEAVAGPATLPGRARVPGSMASHYAPRARVVLVERFDASGFEGRRVAALSPEKVEGMEWIEIPRDPAALARELYTVLREADRRGIEVALVRPPAEQGIGAAVADRLRKAAGPRE